MKTDKLLLHKEEERGTLLPRCLLCYMIPEKGIHGGIKVKKGFICKSCEKDIVNFEVGSKNYLYLLEKIKKLLK